MLRISVHEMAQDGVVVLLWQLRSDEVGVVPFVQELRMCPVVCRRM
jgi:hypothetical protein